MKYIIYETFKTSRSEEKEEVVIVFSELVDHKAVADGLLGKKVSAGFVTVDAEATANGEAIYVSCYGESITMDLKSRLEVDTELVREAVEFKL